MAYQWRVAITLPRGKFGKFYEEPFNFINDVAVERVPFIEADRTSQVSYLRWMSGQGDIAESDQNHISEIVDIFSNLPFDILCMTCGKEKAEKIGLAYKMIKRPYWDKFNFAEEVLEVSYSPFPFFCTKCLESAGKEILEFDLNFDKPFTKMENAYLGRRELLRDLKRMLFYGFEDGPHPQIDPSEIASKMRQERNVLIVIGNRKAKEIVNMMHFLKRRIIEKRTGQLDMFDRRPSTYIPEDYKERQIILISRKKEGPFFLERPVD